MDSPILETMQVRRLAMSPVCQVRSMRTSAGWRIGYAGSWDALRYLEQVPEADYRPYGHLWLPANRANLLLVETIGQVEDASEEYLHLRTGLFAPPAHLLHHYPEPAAGAPAALPHQREAFAYALEAFQAGRHGYANWSEMGTGKTRWAIDVARVVANGCALVVGQNSTLRQWVGEIEANWPEAVPMPLDGTLANREKQIQEVGRLGKKGGDRPLVMLANWEAIAPLRRRFVRVPVSLTIFDESSRAKNRNTHVSKAAWALARNSYRRLCLSGTPMGNDPTDFWAQYRLLDEGLLEPDYNEFTRRYFVLGGHAGNQFEAFKPECVAAFVSKLYTIAYRVTKATIQEMPPKLTRVVELDLLPEQARLYRQVAEQMQADALLEEGGTVRFQVGSSMARILRLQQICAGVLPYQTIRWGEQAVRSEEMGHHRHQTIPSVKTRWTVDWVQETVQYQDAKILIWTRFLPEVRAITGALLQGAAGLTHDQFGYIDGAVKLDERERLRRQFNDRGGPLRVLVCQIQAAAYGIDLPGADVLIYHSHTYSYTDRMQSEDRGHRLGRQRPYQILDLVCRQTVDGQVLQALRKKQNLSDFLMHRGGSFRSVMEAAREEAIWTA